MTRFSDDQLRGKSLRGQQLAGAEFRDCDLTGTSFADADLSGALFFKCFARRSGPVDLEGANLAKAEVVGCDFSYAILAKASLVGAHIQETKLIGGRLGAADFTEAKFDDVDISMAHLHRSKFGAASISKLKFQPVQRLPVLRGLGFSATTSSIRRSIETDDDPKQPFVRFVRAENAITRGFEWLSTRPRWRRIAELPLILIGRTQGNRFNVLAALLLGLAWLGLVFFVCRGYLEQGIASGPLDLPLEFVRGLRGSSTRTGEVEIIEYLMLLLGPGCLWFLGRTLRRRRGLVE